MGVWIETTNIKQDKKATHRHTLYGCVDWNYRDAMKNVPTNRHTLYGCVDWNPYNAAAQ